jgi:hypothetical protein
MTLVNTIRDVNFARIDKFRKVDIFMSCFSQLLWQSRPGVPDCNKGVKRQRSIGKLLKCLDESGLAPSAARYSREYIGEFFILVLITQSKTIIWGTSELE